jgi:hypothetical protein
MRDLGMPFPSETPAETAPSAFRSTPACSVGYRMSRAPPRLPNHCRRSLSLARHAPRSSWTAASWIKAPDRHEHPNHLPHALITSPKHRNTDLRTLWHQDLIAVRPLAVGDSLRGTPAEAVDYYYPGQQRCPLYTSFLYRRIYGEVTPSSPSPPPVLAVLSLWHSVGDGDRPLSCAPPSRFKFESHLLTRRQLVSPELHGGEVQPQLSDHIDRNLPETGRRWKVPPVSPPCFSGEMSGLANFFLFLHQILF